MIDTDPPSLPPFVRLLLKMAERGREGVYPEVGGPVTIRHARNRNPVRSERPCISLICVSDEVRGDDQMRNEWEVVRELVVDLQVDLELTAEDSGLDETGLAALSMTVTAFLRAIRDEEPTSWLDGMCDWISIGSLEPDDRSTPSDGRMTRAITVLYRTRSDDENVLLAAGVNG